MAEWDDRFVFGKQRSEIMFYQRFIDNLLLIWRGSEGTLHQFMNELNENRNNIKLTYQWSNYENNFLDVTIYRDSGDILTKVYYKPTDRNSYLSIIPRDECLEKVKGNQDTESHQWSFISDYHV